ncbi:hypothetical protein A9Q94_19395 [Rhodobacterales bacterium 56_14_T64]|nr:hypothetical protein A9Q94_19395 [Rhodobacterales bacterium 56_14_T64]
MLTRVPFSFALRFDAGAVHQKVQWPRRAAIRDGDWQHPLTTAQGAEIRNSSVQPDQFQQAFNKTSGLLQRQTEQHFDPFSVIVAQ